MSVARRAWWLVPEMAVTAVLGLLVVTRGGSAETVDLPVQLTDRVVAVLENASPTEHHDHGHDIGGEDRVACVAELYGTDPVDAGSMADVRTIYAYYQCASARPGTPFLLSAFHAGPVAVRLTEPPTVLIPRSGAGYPERVRDLLPDEYEEQALKGFRDSTTVDALRPRLEARLSAPPGTR